MLWVEMSAPEILSPNPAPRNFGNEVSADVTELGRGCQGDPNPV